MDNMCIKYPTQIRLPFTYGYINTTWISTHKSQYNEAYVHKHLRIFKHKCTYNLNALFPLTQFCGKSTHTPIHTYIRENHVCTTEYNNWTQFFYIPKKCSIITFLLVQIVAGCNGQWDLMWKLKKGILRKQSESKMLWSLQMVCTLHGVNVEAIIVIVNFQTKNGKTFKIIKSKKQMETRYNPGIDIHATMTIFR